MPTIVAIDPGVTGAMATYVSGPGPQFVLVDIDDLPVADSVVDAIEMERFLALRPDMIVIEDTQPMPKNGSIASFKLGLNTGIIRGVVGAMSIPLTRVKPITWKRNLGLIGANKDRSLLMARELFPDMSDELKLAKHHNRAEAALIGRWYILNHTLGATDDV